MPEPSAVTVDLVHENLRMRRALEAIAAITADWGEYPCYSVHVTAIQAMRREAS